MKRSEINTIMSDAKNFLASKQFFLPPWAFWSIAEWKKNQEIAAEVINNRMGWDITDFGFGDFYKRGLFLFTLRNGNLNVDKKNYAEKIMIVEEDQETPFHYHRSKMEDIICRGGGNLIIELYNSTADNKLEDSHVRVKIDGIERTHAPGGKVVLHPGESISLEQGMFHRFYGEFGKGKVLVGEVSMVNDDASDNYFFEPMGRFSVIEEDVEAMHLLVSDYANFLEQ